MFVHLLQKKIKNLKKEWKKKHYTDSTIMYTKIYGTVYCILQIFFLEKL